MENVAEKQAKYSLAESQGAVFEGSREHGTPTPDTGAE